MAFQQSNEHWVNVGRARWRSLANNRFSICCLGGIQSVDLHEQDGYQALDGGRGSEVIEKNGAGDGARTRDVQLGKLAFYH